MTALTARTTTAGPAQHQNQPQRLEQPLAIERRRRILRLLAEREYVTIGEVRDFTGRSAATVYRDLAVLARIGALVRVRGGATRINAETNGSVEDGTHLDQLRRILDSGNILAIEAALRQALLACERARRRNPVRAPTLGP